MSFQIKLYFFCFVIVSSSFCLKEKNKNSIFIYNDDSQCKDCPKEIGTYLNNLKVIPIMSYLSSGNIMIDNSKEKYFFKEYSNYFKFNVLPIKKKLVDFDKYPILIKIIQNDTSYLSYNQIFAFNGNLNKKEIKNFACY